MYKKMDFCVNCSNLYERTEENCENYGDVSLFNSEYKIYATINIVFEYILD